MPVEKLDFRWVEKSMTCLRIKLKLTKRSILIGSLVRAWAWDRVKPVESQSGQSFKYNLLQSLKLLFGLSPSFDVCAQDEKDLEGFCWADDIISTARISCTDCWHCNEKYCKQCWHLFIIPCKEKASCHIRKYRNVVALKHNYQEHCKRDKAAPKLFLATQIRWTSTARLDNSSVELLFQRSNALLPSAGALKKSLNWLFLSFF